ncbi:hypothetical protein HQ529_03490 [Candidatus Woesearchaeota archaeon]|nr:hypothetical protein [Candidatus Woesearchaeota archaeon]
MTELIIKFETDYKIETRNPSDAIREAIKLLEADLKKHKGKLSELFNVDIKCFGDRAWN